MKKKVLIIGGSALVVVAAVVGLIFLFANKGEAYRVIKILQEEGIISVARDTVGDLEGYEGMSLESGDAIHVSGNSNMVMQMDEDKYCYVDENTDFSVEAEGTSKNSKSRIEVQEGSITFDIQKKLNKNSSYEISTPNSTMAIRGTMIYLNVTELETKIYLLEGKLEVTIPSPAPGTPQKVDLKEGQKLTITETDQGSVIQIEDLTPEDVEQLSKLAKGAIKDRIANGDGGSFLTGITISDDNETQDTGVRHVYFEYQGNVFCVQELTKGDIIEVPKLQPTKNGYWDVNFSEPVDIDVVAKWIETEQ